MRSTINMDSKFLWAEAAATAVYIKNRLPHSTLPKHQTTYEDRRPATRTRPTIPPWRVSGAGKGRRLCRHRRSPIHLLAPRRHPRLLSRPRRPGRPRLSQRRRNQRRPANPRPPNRRAEPHTPPWPSPPPPLTRPGPRSNLRNRKCTKCIPRPPQLPPPSPSRAPRRCRPDSERSSLRRTSPRQCGEL